MPNEKHELSHHLHHLCQVFSTHHASDVPLDCTHQQRGSVMCVLQLEADNFWEECVPDECQILNCWLLCLVLVDMRAAWRCGFAGGNWRLGYRFNFRGVITHHRMARESLQEVPPLLGISISRQVAFLLKLAKTNWWCALVSCSLILCQLWEEFLSLMPQHSRKRLEVHPRTWPLGLQSLGEMPPSLARLETMN